jgi:hypothetical protein
MYIFKNNEIVILLGAGASVDAGIPHSADMIQRLENLIRDEDKWQDFQELYNYVRSSIYHSFGIQGRFGTDVNYNIETLVNTLDELTKKQEHTLYPFVGAWNPTLVELAGSEFYFIKDLKGNILHELRGKWLELPNKELAAYYKGLIAFKTDYQYPLRVFGLNYDLCLETACEQEDLEIELGFNEERKWDWRQFTDTNPDETPDIYYYKLHGSTNWQYDPDDRLTFTDAPNTIDDDKAAIIFGTSIKLQYRDPFLFLVYEFRKWILECKLLICVGYSFGDEHINKIIQQALSLNKERLLLSISPFKDSDSKESVRKQQEEVARMLNHRNTEQIACRSFHANQFMLEKLKLDYLGDLFPQEEQPFPIVA